MPSYKRNVLLLALCQALFTSTTSMMIAMGALVGHALATDKGLATLPVTAQVLGMALATMPASLLMKRVGRRLGFILGCLVGISGGLVAALAVVQGSFWLFALGSALVGVFAAHGLLYRFAATDTAPPDFRARAISWVLAGGVAAGFLGPQIAKWTRPLLPVEYVGAYLAVAGLCLLSIGLLAWLDIPRPRDDPRAVAARPLGVIVRQPRFVVAALSAMVGYAVMNLIMTGTPLAMVGHHHRFDDAAMVIQWHVVAMYLPSFVTGAWISRFGVQRIIFTGVVLMFAAIGTGLGGTSLPHFWVALIFLGVGWNFMFIGGSTLLTSTHSENERYRTQGLNDFLIFGSMAVASLSSGQLLYHLGWQMVLVTGVPFLGLSAAALLWLAWLERRELRPEG